VKCEVVHLVEGFVADIALELFFPAVSQFVVLVVSLKIKHEYEKPNPINRAGKLYIQYNNLK